MIDFIKDQEDIKNSVYGKDFTITKTSYGIVCCVKDNDVSITYNKHKYNFGDMTYCFHIYMYENNIFEGVAVCAKNEIGHPHVSKESVCLGESGVVINSLVSSGYLLPAIQNVSIILRNYGPRPFVRIEEYKGAVRPCNVCSNIEFCNGKCQKTDKYICKNCKPLCLDNLSETIFLPEYLEKCLKCSCLSHKGKFIKNKFFCPNCVGYALSPELTEPF